MKNKNFLFSLFMAFSVMLFLQTSCNNAGEGESAESDTIVDEHAGDEHAGHEHAKEAAHWSYEGETGPAHWAEIVTDCDCGGMAQSPIDIVGSVKGENLSDLVLNYSAYTELDIVNNGHSIQVNYPQGEFVVGDVTYKLAQFHFHAGSEHFIAGKQFALEAHLVHVSDDGQIAVIGVMVEEGAENAFFSKFWGQLPETAEAHTTAALDFDVTNILPADKSYFHYSGSLTTPPCTEGVQWFVYKNAIEASAEQIAKLASLMPKDNFRPVQAVNDRVITDF